MLAKFGNCPTLCSDFFTFQKQLALNLVTRAIGDFPGILKTEQHTRIVPQQFLFQRVLALALRQWQVTKDGHGLARCDVLQ